MGSKEGSSSIMRIDVISVIYQRGLVITSARWRKDLVNGWGRGARNKPSLLEGGKPREEHFSRTNAPGTGRL